jgi:hypothetical protein
MTFILIVVAVILFLLAGFKDGIHFTWQDFIAFGLAAFAASFIRFTMVNFDTRR